MGCAWSHQPNRQPKCKPCIFLRNIKATWFGTCPARAAMPFHLVSPSPELSRAGAAREPPKSSLPIP